MQKISILHDNVISMFKLNIFDLLNIYIYITMITRDAILESGIVTWLKQIRGGFRRLTSANSIEGGANEVQPV